jgi:hypothetical protein
MSRSAGDPLRTILTGDANASSGGMSWKPRPAVQSGRKRDLQMWMICENSVRTEFSHSAEQETRRDELDESNGRRELSRSAVTAEEQENAGGDGRQRSQVGNRKDADDPLVHAQELYGKPDRPR